MGSYFESGKDKSLKERDVFPFFRCARYYGTMTLTVFMAISFFLKLLHFNLIENNIDRRKYLQ